MLYCFLLTGGNQLWIQEGGTQRSGGEVAARGALNRGLCPPGKRSGVGKLRGSIPREHTIHRCGGQHLRGSLRGVGKQ